MQLSVLIVLPFTFRIKNESRGSRVGFSIMTYITVENAFEVRTGGQSEQIIDGL